MPVTPVALSSELPLDVLLWASWPKHSPRMRFYVHELVFRILLSVDARGGSQQGFPLVETSIMVLVGELAPESYLMSVSVANR